MTIAVLAVVATVFVADLFTRPARAPAARQPEPEAVAEPDGVRQPYPIPR